jgi:uncharacterized protein
MRKTTLFTTISVLLVSVLAACSPSLGSFVAANQPAQITASPAAQVNQPAPNGLPTRSISVSGTGKVTLTPDIAYVNIGVHSEAKDAKEALAANNAQVQKVIDAIKGTGIDAKDIQTTNFNIYPNNQYDSTGALKETRYAVDNTVYVTVRKLDSLGGLLDTVVTNGANNINGIQFDVADKTAALADARKQAIQDARSQAEQLAAAAGLKLGDIQSINMSTTSQPLPMYAAFGKGGGAPMAADASVPVSSGQMILTADINMVFAIQ